MPDRRLRCPAKNHSLQWPPNRINQLRLSNCFRWQPFDPDTWTGSIDPIDIGFCQSTDYCRTQLAPCCLDDPYLVRPRDALTKSAANAETIIDDARQPILWGHNNGSFLGSL